MNPSWPSSHLVSRVGGWEHRMAETDSDDGLGTEPLTPEELATKFEAIAARYVERQVELWVARGLPPGPLARALLSFGATLSGDVEGFRATAELLEDAAD